MSESNYKTIDTTKIQNDLDLFEAGVEGHVQTDEVVLVIGSTRSGKSTVMNILAGKEIEVQKDGWNYFIDVVGGDYAGAITATGFRPMAISHGCDACTTFPNYIIVEGKQFWDCPGFNDNRGLEVEISNAYYVNKILSYTAEGMGGVKFIIVQDSDGIGVHGGKSFTDCIETICKIFNPSQSEDFENLIDATSFVFTKVAGKTLAHETFTRDQYIKDVCEQLATNMSELDQEKLLSTETQACFAFIREMTSRGGKLNHVEVPKAYWKKCSDMRVFTDPIMCPKTGILGSVKSSVSLKKTPQVTVSNRGVVEAYNLHVAYQQKLDNLAEQQLGEELRITFGRHDHAEALSVIYEVLNVLKCDTSELAHGGATTKSKQLVRCLKKLEGSENFAELLSSINKIIDTIGTVDFILKNVLAGANFTVLSKAVREAASDYLDVREFREMRELEDVQLAFIDEENHFTTVKRALAAPVIVTGVALAVILQTVLAGILLGGNYPVGMKNNPFHETDFEFVEKVVKKIYGKPNEAAEKRLAEIKEMQKDVKKN